MAEQGESQGPVGVGLLVAAYAQERGADQTLEMLKQARSAGGIGYDDAAVVRRDAEGAVHIHETGDMSAGKGAGIGALIGGVIGILGGPAGVAVGAGAGAALGGLAAHPDTGFDQRSLERLGAALPAGTSALVVTTSQDFVEAVRAEASEDALTMAGEIAAVVQDHLRARQDVLLGMVLSDAGVAATKIVHAPDELAVFGIAVTESGVAARAGLVTPQGAAVVDAVAVPAPEATDEGSEPGTTEGDEGQAS